MKTPVEPCATSLPRPTHEAAAECGAPSKGGFYLHSFDTRGPSLLRQRLAQLRMPLYARAGSQTGGGECFIAPPSMNLDTSSALFAAVPSPGTDFSSQAAAQATAADGASEASEAGTVTWQDTFSTLAANLGLSSADRPLGLSFGSDVQQWWDWWTSATPAQPTAAEGPVGSEESSTSTCEPQEDVPHDVAGAADSPIHDTSSNESPSLLAFNQVPERSLKEGESGVSNGAPRQGFSPRPADRMCHLEPVDELAERAQALAETMRESLGELELPRQVSALLRAMAEAPERVQESMQVRLAACVSEDHQELIKDAEEEKEEVLMVTAMRAEMRIAMTEEEEDAKSLQRQAHAPPPGSHGIDKIVEGRQVEAFPI